MSSRSNCWKFLLVVFTFCWPSLVCGQTIWPNLDLTDDTGILPEMRMRYKSARLDALQMGVAIEDEANIIGLEKWADNPAGLAMDENSSRLVAVYDFGTSQWGGDDQDRDFPGLYGVYRKADMAVSAQLNSQTWEQGELFGDAKSQTFGEIRFNRNFDRFLAGVNVANWSEDSSPYGSPTSFYESDPMSFGAGIGYKLERFVLGLNAGQSSGTFTMAGSDDEERTFRYEGVQAIYVNPGLMRAGFEIRRFQEELKEGASKQEDDGYELRARGFYHRADHPLRIGIEGSLRGEKIDWIDSGFHMTDDDKDTSRFTVGASLVSPRWGLVGLEYRYLNQETEYNLLGDTDKSSRSNIALGGEITPTAEWALRLSYSRFTASFNDADDKSASGDFVGIGVGYLLSERFKLDGSYNHSSVDYSEEGETFDWPETKWSLMGSWYF